MSCSTVTWTTTMGQQIRYCELNFQYSNAPGVLIIAWHDQVRDALLTDILQALETHIRISMNSNVQQNSLLSGVIVLNLHQRWLPYLPHGLSHIMNAQDGNEANAKKG